jgi:sulfate/thiosulfate transport system ATP-binding protein
VVVMNQGRVAQMGTPDEVYEEPATPFVCDFLGSTNRFRPGSLAGEAGAGSVAYARPHEIELSREAGEGMPGRVTHLHAIGPLVRIEVQREGSDETLEVELSKAEFRSGGFQLGDVVPARPRRLRVYPADGGAS